MALINLKDFIEKEKITVMLGDIFVANVGNSSLIGPKVSSTFCSTCLKKRILSSEFKDFFNYHIFIKDKQKKKYFNKVGLENIILEITKNKKATEHHFILIPGCNHSYYNAK